MASHPAHGSEFQHLDLTRLQAQRHAPNFLAAEVEHKRPRILAARDDLRTRTVPSSSRGPLVPEKAAQEVVGGVKIVSTPPLASCATKPCVNSPSRSTISFQCVSPDYSRAAHDPSPASCLAASITLDGEQPRLRDAGCTSCTRGATRHDPETARGPLMNNPG